jgi:uncharacterized membrane protein
MNNTYLILKLLHVFGVILFLGNIILTAWWKLMANRTKNPLIIAFAQHQVTLTDRILMNGSVVLIFVTGALSVVAQEMDWNIRWLVWSTGLFMLSGVIWGFLVIPIRNKLAKMAREFSKDSVIPESYWRLERIWMVFGILATLPLLMILYLMVFKPSYT